MMKKTLAALAGASMLFGSAGVAGATELARARQVERPPMTLAPPTGLAGSTFEVSGENCPGETVHVRSTEDVESPDRTVPTDDDGNWSTEFTVHEDVDINRIIRVNAECLGSPIVQPNVQGFRGSSNVLFSYQTVYFEVIADPTLAVSPSSGPAESSFEVSGVDCSLSDADESVTVTAGDVERTVTPDGDGEWTATFTVPAGAAVGSTIDVGAVCSFSNFVMVPNIRRAPSGGDVETFDYDDAVFTVTGGDTTTPQPTASTPTADDAVAATAATPTTAQPTFTG